MTSGEWQARTSPSGPPFRARRRAADATSGSAMLASLGNVATRVLSGKIETLKKSVLEGFASARPAFRSLDGLNWRFRCQAPHDRFGCGSSHGFAERLPKRLDEVVAPVGGFPTVGSFPRRTSPPLIERPIN